MKGVKKTGSKGSIAFFYNGHLCSMFPLTEKKTLSTYQQSSRDMNERDLRDHEEEDFVVGVGSGIRLDDVEVSSVVSFDSSGDFHGKLRGGVLVLCRESKGKLFLECFIMVSWC